MCYDSKSMLICACWIENEIESSHITCREIKVEHHFVTESAVEILFKENITTFFNGGVLDIIILHLVN